MTQNLPVLAAPLAPVAWPSPSNFEAYARMANQWPVLDAPEEAALLARWHDHADKDAARELVLSHLRLVVRVVRAHRGYGLPAGDLAQEGTVGLMKAVQRFDASLGVRLAAYAVHWIEAEVREFIFRNWRIVRLGTSAAMKKLFFGYRQTLAQLNDWRAQRPVGVEADEVAQALGVEPDHVRLAQSYFGGRDLGLDAPAAGEDVDASPSQPLLLEALPDGETPATRAQDIDSRRAIKSAVHSALASLPERDRAVLVARRLAQPPEGLAQIGDRLGISAERVRQIEARAAKHLEQALREAGAQALLS